MGAAVMEKTYLDDNGNPIAPQVYLDDNGNPVGAATVSPTTPTPLTGAQQLLEMAKRDPFVKTATGIVKGGVDAVAGIGSGLYHAFTDPASESDKVGGVSLPYVPTVVKRLFVDPQTDQYRRAKEAQAQGNTSEMVGHSIAAAVPVAGPAAAAVGERAGTGDIPGAIGQGAVYLALPSAAKKLGEIARTPTEAPLDLYRTAMRRGIKVGSDISKNREIAATGLKYGISVSESGLDKLDGLVKDLEASVKQRVDAGANQGFTVNKYSAASRLSDMAKKAQQQANPAADLAAIDKAGNEFLAAHPAEIPVDEALQIKKGTYRAVGDRAYGEESTAAAQAQKNLARGINEELGNLFPEIKPQLASESELLRLRKAVVAAVNKESNAPSGRGLTTMAAAGLAKGLTGSGMAGLGVGILKAVLDDPAVKSELAIALNKNPAKGAPPSGNAASVFRILKVSGVLGAAQRKANEASDR